MQMKLEDGKITTQKRKKEKKKTPFEALNVAYGPSVPIGN